MYFYILFSITQSIIIHIILISGKPRLFLIQACWGKQVQEQVAVPDSLETLTQIGQVGRNDEFSENRRRLTSTTEHSEPSASSDILSPDTHGFLPKQI